jgi:hypothetical protein
LNIDLFSRILSAFGFMLDRVPLPAEQIMDSVGLGVRMVCQPSNPRPRELPEHFPRDVIVGQRSFSCRFIVSQADGFSSEHDLGAIFAALLNPAGAFETATVGSLHSRICAVLASRCFSQVRYPAA